MSTEAWGADWDGYESDVDTLTIGRHGRYGKADKRGNTQDRKARKLWLLATYDPELGPRACRCFHCGKRLTFATVTADRIIPGAYGGTYRRENLRPACIKDNRAQGDKMWQMSCPLPTGGLS